MIIAQTLIKLEFESAEEAGLIYHAIKPETSSLPADRASVEFIHRRNEIELYIKAADSASFRASVNSYLRWIMLSRGILKK